jgi:hypothetical protein
LGEKAFQRACQKIKDEYEKFNISCQVFDGKKFHILAMTKTAEACDEIKQLWSEVWTAPEHLILQRSFTAYDKRVAFFKNTLLAKTSKRDFALTHAQLDTNRRGNFYRTNNNTLRERVMTNLADYKKSQSDVDCGPGILPSMDRVPVLNQQSQGTCYAHAASTLIDYIKRFKMGGQSVYGSPLMAAIDYKLSVDTAVTTSSDPFASGSTCLGFNAQMSKGFCNSDEMEKAIINSFNPGGKTKKTSWYLNWSKSRIAFNTDGFRIKPDDYVLEYLYVIGDLYEKGKWSELEGLWKKLNLNAPESCKNPETFDEKLKWALIKKSPDMEQFYFQYFEGLCNRTKLPFKASCLDYGVQSTSKIDSWLKEGYPLGISYCSALLTNKNYVSGTKPLNEDKSCGPHASVLIGTAKDKKGRCTYVVRNSWGTNCKSYDSDFDCSGGNIYIPKAT